MAAGGRVGGVVKAFADGWKILIVEDERAVVGSLISRLNRMGHTVTVADYNDAEAWLRKYTFDFIVLDQRLRKDHRELHTGGTLLYDYIRRGEFGEGQRHARVAFYTAFPAADIRKDLSSRGYVLSDDFVVVGDSRWFGIFSKVSGPARLLRHVPSLERSREEPVSRFRTLVRVDAVERMGRRKVLSIVVPGWDSAEVIPVGLSRLPEFVSMHLEHSVVFPVFLSADANLAATASADLGLDNFRLLRGQQSSGR